MNKILSCTYLKYVKMPCKNPAPVPTPPHPLAKAEGGLAYLDNVENHVLIETVQDTLGHTIVAPGAVDQQQLLQVGELRGKNGKVQERPSFMNKSHKTLFGDRQRRQGSQILPRTRENHSLPETIGRAFGSSEDN